MKSSLLALTLIASSPLFVGCPESRPVRPSDVTIDEDASQPEPERDADVPPTEAGSDATPPADPEAGMPEPPYRACNGLTLYSGSSSTLEQGCTHIQGDLIVREFVSEASKRVALEEALAFVTKVDGKVILDGNDALSSLDALRSLQTVGGDLIVIDNAKLTDLHGLTNLTKVEGDLLLHQLPVLAKLDGLEHLRQVRAFSLVGLFALRELAPVSLASARGVSIRDCEQLETLKGLEALQILEEPLELMHDAKLSDLRGLDGLASVAELTVSDNELLSSLTGLEQLVEVKGDMVLDELPALSSLKGLGSLRRAGSVRVTDNPRISRCEAERLFHEVDTDPASIVFERNADDSCP